LYQLAAGWPPRTQDVSKRLILSASWITPCLLYVHGFISLISDRVSSFLVAHGRGSDPGHTGWLQRFSNEIGSKASSRGSYRTGEFYEGKYGRSMRLAGLDADNSNAEARAIVIHPAWYVGEDMLSKYGKLGRSEGCFALSPAGLDAVFARLGPGRLLYAGKF